MNIHVAESRSRKKAQISENFLSLAKGDYAIAKNISQTYMVMKGISRLLIVSKPKRRPVSLILR